MDGPGRSRPMGGNTHGHDARGFRRRRRGVASIVGALLVLLIVLVAFTLLFTEAVPVWMAQNETVLEQQDQASLAQLQATVDLQDAFGTPHTALTSIGLTSAAVPVLAAPTQGSLLFEADSIPAFVNLSTAPGSGGSTGYDTNVSLGQLSVVLPNRYIPSETLRFENGAVFVVGDASPSRLVFAPLFSVAQSGTNQSLAFTIVSLTGPTSGASSGGTQQIADTVRSTTTVVSHGAPLPGGGYGSGSVTVRIGSSNACAWANFFTGALADAGFPSSEYAVVGPAGCTSGSPSFGVTTVTMDAITYASVTWLTLSVELEAGGA